MKSAEKRIQSYVKKTIWLIPSNKAKNIAQELKNIETLEEKIRNLESEQISNYQILKENSAINSCDEKNLDYLICLQKGREIAKERNLRTFQDSTVVQRKLAKELTKAKEQCDQTTHKPSFSYSRFFTKSSPNQAATTAVHVTAKGAALENSDVEGSFEIGKHRFAVSGLFEGHNGPKASEFLSKHLVAVLKSKFEEALTKTGHLSDVDVFNLLKITGQELDAEFQNTGDLSGCTGTFSICIDNNQLWTANIGEGKTILVGGDNQTLQLSVARKVMFDPGSIDADVLEQKKEEILHHDTAKSYQKRGGHFSTSTGYMRSFGDRKLRNQAHSARVKISKIDLSPLSKQNVPYFLVHGTSTFWQKTSPKQVGEAIANNYLGESTETLCQNLVHAAQKNNPAIPMSCLLKKLPSFASEAKEPAFESSSLSTQCSLEIEVAESLKEKIAVRASSSQSSKDLEMEKLELTKALEMHQINAIRLFDQIRRLNGPVPARERHLIKSYRKELKNNPVYREHRMILSEELIKVKLERELEYAHLQATKEKAKDSFHYQKASNDFIRNSHLSSDQLSAAVHAQGPRDSQEDTDVIASFSVTDRISGNIHQVDLSGIFDGHGGSVASSFLQKELKNKLQEIFQKLHDQTLEGPLAVLNQEQGLTKVAIWNILKYVCVELNQDFKKQHPDELSGSTASFSITLDGKLWTANLGDSRTILVSKKQSLQLTEDAKLQVCFLPPISEKELDSCINKAVEGVYSGAISNLKEDKAAFKKYKKESGIGRYEKSIWKRGGSIYWWGVTRLNGTLAVSRAFGDAAHQDYGLSARCKVTCVDLKSLKEVTEGIDDWMLLHACDGVWDVASTSQVVGAVREGWDDNLAILTENLCYSALKAGSMDNVSCVLRKLPKSLFQD
jgi:serine/threonine protein phosphatase PrpC